MGASSFSMGTHSSLSQGIFITSSSSPCSIVIRFQLKHYPVLFIRSTCRLHSLSLPWPLLPSPFLKAAHPTRPLRLLLQQDVNKAMMENSRLPLSMDHLLLWPSAKHPPVAKRTSCPQSSLMVSLPTLKAALVPSLQTTNSNSMVLLHKLAHSTLQASQSARMVLWLLAAQQSSTLARAGTSPTSMTAPGPHNASLSSWTSSHAALQEALVNNLMDDQHSPPPLPRFLKLVTVNHKQPLPSTHLSPRSVTVRFKGLLLPQCHLSLKSAMDRFRFLPEFPSLRLVMDKFKSQHLLQLLLSPRSRMDRSRSPLLPPPRSLRSPMDKFRSQLSLLLQSPRSLMDGFRSQPSHPLQSRKSATDKSRSQLSLLPQ